MRYLPLRVRSWASTGLVVVVAGILVAWPQIARLQQSDPTTLPLIQRSDITYLGSFAVPTQDAQSGLLTYGGQALGFNPQGNGGQGSLFFGCHDWFQQLAEVSIPAFGQTATILQPCTDVTEGTLGNLGDSSSKLGGNLVWNGRLITTGYVYYDATNSQQRSHGAGSPTLSINDFTNFFQFTGATAPARALAGYMTPIPAEWRTLFGGPALTGQGGLSIVSNSSDGPSVTVFDPDNVGGPLPIPGTTVLEYPYPLGHPDFQAKGSVLAGVAFPPNSRSVLFFGTRAQLPYCYGTPEECPGTCGAGKGPQNQYHHAFWAYDANDLLAVKNGQKQPEELREYAVFEVSDITSGQCASINFGGATFDQQNGILYATEVFGENPRVHAFRIGDPTPDTTAPVISNVGSTNITDRSADITWTTDESADSLVEYRVVGALNWTATTLAPALTTSHSVGITGLLPSTTYQYRVTSKDGAGNASTSTVATLTTSIPDVLPPIISNIASGSITQNSATITWTTNEIADTTVEYGTTTAYGQTATATPLVTSHSIPLTGLSGNTTYHYRVKSKDAAGNEATSADTTFTTPDQPPAVLFCDFEEGSGTSADCGALTGTISGATWTASGKYGSALSFDGTNDVVTVNDDNALDLASGMTLEAWVRPSALGGTSADWRTVLLKEMTNELAYSLYAGSGDQGAQPSGYARLGGASVKVQGSSSLPLNAWSHVAVTYEGSALRLYVNGVEVASQITSGQIATSNGPLRIGGNSIWGEYFAGVIDEVRVYDRQLTVAEIQADMNGTSPPPDTTPPTVSLTAPANNATVSGTTTAVSATAADAVGVTGVQFKLDGQNLGTEDTSSPYAVTWDTTTATNATHTLTATARDAAGNTTTSTAITVTVSNVAPDTTPPTVSLTAPANNATVSGTTTAVSATAADAVGVTGVQFKLDGQNLGTEDTSSPYAVTWDTTTATNATHTLTATARDAAGNTTTSTAITVTVNNAPTPVPSITCDPLSEPTGTIVDVANITQLESAITNLASDTTIRLASGTYTLADTLYLPQNISNVSIRGASGNRADVVIRGAGMAGAIRFGFWADNVTNVTFADMTVRDLAEHAFIMNGGVEAPHYYNVHMIDIGDQFIKNNPLTAGTEGVDNGTVDCSMLEYSTEAPDTYTNGVDVHSGKNWIIRNNTFKNIRTSAGLAGPAILMWNSSRDTVTQNNLFLNTQRGISYGLIDQPSGRTDHSGGIIRNNIFYRSAAQSGDVAIHVADAPNTKILNNTVMLNGTYPNAIEYRFAQTTNTEVRYNLTDSAIVALNSAAGTVNGNYTSATDAYFVNPGANDFHLVDSIATRANAIDRALPHADVTVDYDNDTRPEGLTPDRGADEYKPGPAPNVSPTITVTPTSPFQVRIGEPLTFTVVSTDPDGDLVTLTFSNLADFTGATFE